MDLSELIYGYRQTVPTRRGDRQYVNLDNAASTPPFKRVIEAICQEAAWYSSIHRGTGYKSRYMTEKYENARKIVADFVGADLTHDVVIFTKNTTDSLNKLSHYLQFLPGEWVVHTALEHHSNELPWAKYSNFAVGLDGPGINLGEAEDFLKRHAGQVKLLAVSGASNVTGHTPSIYTLAELAHAAGAKIAVDGAQLVPHRPVNMYPPSDPRHLDFLAFSAHKMYAPFGVGVLIGPRALFQRTPPSQVGGGTVKGISAAGIIWSDPPEVEEAGSPNVLGVTALTEAIQVLSSIGWPSLIEHETQLMQYTLEQLLKIPGITVFNPEDKGRVGVISFDVAGLHHQEVAAYLADEWGIGVRSGCFCARKYVRLLLNLNSNQLQTAIAGVVSNHPESVPGLVRVSFGCYNQLGEAELLCQALTELLRLKPQQ